MLGFKVDKMLSRLKELEQFKDDTLKGDDYWLVRQGAEHFANVIEVVLSAFGYEKVAILHRKMFEGKFKQPE